VFNIEEFDIKLNTEVLARNFVYLEEIDSTNSFLLESKDYRENGTIVMAEYQLRGKGRKDRDWVASKEQALTFSLLLNENIDNKNIHVINLGASLAIAQALENLHQLKVNLKWPNDVLISNKKIAGILIESTSKGSEIEKMVIGIGINVNQPNFKGKFSMPPTSVRLESKRAVSRERLLSEILNNFEGILIQISKDKDKVLQDWKSRCQMIGGKVKVFNDEKEEFGIFDDIDENGFLVLKSKSGAKTIYHGDVSLS
jgi:BirA family biotin operon repressor/biotin-[acetyl-CoA-carboxylase] ligase